MKNKRRNLTCLIGVQKKWEKSNTWRIEGANFLKLITDMNWYIKTAKNTCVNNNQRKKSPKSSQQVK